ncbi:MAG: hypothetical protein QXZ43_00845 [Candidatus Aenigmatarchaeota archaeon]
MEEKIFLIGIILIFAGILLTIISAFLSGNKKINFAFGGFIGPIPFGWATDYKYLIIILFLLLFSILIFFYLR